MHHAVSTPYPIIEINDERLRKPEHVGTKEKFWIKHNDQFKLVKFGRDHTGENWAEKVCCELSGLLGLPHAHYEMASFKGIQCVLSTAVHPAGCELILGNQIIGKAGDAIGQARQYRRKEHTISRVIAAIVVQTRPEAAAACRVFCGYLMFDAWVGNTDRHEENWGILVHGDGRREISPTFDHASSLGRELLDTERVARLSTRDERFSVAAFSGKARSALFKEASDRKPLRPIEAFSEMAKIFLPDALKWLDRLEKVSSADIDRILQRMPPGSVSNASAAFARALLLENQTRLLELGWRR